MFLINRLLLIKLYSKVELQQMNISINIQEIGTNYYIINQFIHINMFIKTINKVDDTIIVYICKKFYVINDLKVNILIGTNILRTEDINLKFSTNEIVFINHKNTTALMQIQYKNNILHIPFNI